jgi:predicted DNA-binding transcriptional regulator AlpA
MTKQDERLLRIGDVLAMTGIRSRQTIWRKARKGHSPHQSILLATTSLQRGRFPACRNGLPKE